MTAKPLRIQMWSYNYAPEPTGIAPLSTVWAEEMAARDHDVLVVAAHPHYPEPAWGRRLRPYRERQGDIPVLRLPLKIGRRSSRERLLQELSYVSALALASPLLPRADVIVAVSPSFPALLPAMATARARRVPWVLWLQDILPDGAVATGILDEGRLVSLARALERAAYRAASRVVVISESFEENLRRKGVPAEKLVQIFNVASRPIRETLRPESVIEAARVITMGNIGHSQGLAAHVRAFERSAELERLGGEFLLVGDGVAGDEVRAAIDSKRVRVTGVIHDYAELERHLLRATVATVTQHYEGSDFNVPSKLMNFMGYGLPVVASVQRGSEVGRIVERSGGGWVTDSSRPDEWAAQLVEAMRDPAECARRSDAALGFAHRHFTRAHAAERFERLLREVVGEGPRRSSTTGASPTT